MSKLMFNIVSSDIRILELKLEKTRIEKMLLMNKKPSLFDFKKLNIWNDKISVLIEKENDILKELQTCYNEIGINLN